MYQRITTSLHYRSLLEPLVIHHLCGSKSKTVTSCCACMSSVGCDKALSYKWIHKAHSPVLCYFSSYVQDTYTALIRAEVVLWDESQEYFLSMTGIGSISDCTILQSLMD
ncbi:hypothetical protein VNO77_04086 [Canavalia gladiata]|uniref:Uncharacterized protein n=1 Tax=Canavalia gladiata TaxID=3824 RepID=A0AAN9N1K8_CANGL